MAMDVPFMARDIPCSAHKHSSSRSLEYRYVSCYEFLKNDPYVLAIQVTQNHQSSRNQFNKVFLWMGCEGHQMPKQVNEPWERIIEGASLIFSLFFFNFIPYLNVALASKR